TQCLEDADFAAVEEQLEAFRRFLIPRIFRYAPPPVSAVLVLVIGAALALWLGTKPMAWVLGGSLSALLLAALFVLHQLGKRQSEPAATTLAVTLSRANHR